MSSSHMPLFTLDATTLQRARAQAAQSEQTVMAVLASQTEGQTFPVFVSRVVKAGCVGYFAYLDGRKVVYLGRLGYEHVEFFPQ